MCTLGKRVCLNRAPAVRIRLSPPTFFSSSKVIRGGLQTGVCCATMVAHGPPIVGNARVETDTLIYAIPCTRYRANPPLSARTELYAPLE